MIKISTLRRLGAIALVAGAASLGASAASADGDFKGFDRVDPKPASGIPGFQNPIKTAPKRVDARQYFIGTWRVQLKNGARIAVKFTAKGHFFLIHSSNTKVVEVGHWKIIEGKLVLLPVGKCLRSDMKQCRKYDQRKTVQVTFRIVDKNRVEAPAGTFQRHV